MREIKVRAWDKKKNKWLSFDEGDPIQDDYSLFDEKEQRSFWAHFWDFDEDEVVLMQYTGLKDKNKREIYEGDILQADGMRMVVIWKEDIACFGVQAQGWMYTHYFGEGVDNATSEVIGNIYEDHELIEYKHV